MTETERIASLADLRPGDVMLGPIGGLVPGVFPVGVGHLMLGEVFRIGRLSVRHAGIVVKASEHLPPGTVRHRKSGEWRPGPAPKVNIDPDVFDVYPTGVITAPVVVEAMPRGARLRELRTSTDWTDRHAYLRLPEDYPGQREQAAGIAEAMVGTPYSFASYAALAAWRWGLKVERLATYINRRRPGPGNPLGLPAELICSQLVDEAYTLAGKQVMPHGTRPQIVTPGALARQLWTMPGVVRGGVGVL